jgi:hypothetical protein
MARPKGAPKTAKEINLEDRQIQAIEALRLIAPFGKPDFSVVVRAAIDSYLQAEISKMSPEVRARFDRIIRGAATRVVSLGRSPKNPPV